MQNKNIEEMLELILESTSDAIITTDVNCVIDRINSNAEKITGWQSSDAIGKKLNVVFDLKNLQNDLTTELIFDEILQNKNTARQQTDVILFNKKGKRIDIANTFYPIMDSAEKIVGILSVFRCTTEQQIVSEQLRQAQKMNTIGQMTSCITHDFNNMLSGIMGVSELLERQISDNQKARNFANVIYKTASRAAELIEKILSFSRKDKCTATTVDIEQTLNDALVMLRHSINKNINIETKVDLTSRLVTGCPSQILNVFINLGINASDSMPEGGKLIIELHNIDVDLNSDLNSDLISSLKIPAGKYIKIIFNDQGCGISEEMINRIFDPFFTTKSQGKGTGLGLSIVYETLMQHNGGIKVFSEKGKGTSVSVFLPIKVIQKNNQKTQLIDEPIKGSGTIFVIDDEEVIRNTMKWLLSDLGYSVLLASNGEDGLEIFNINRDIIDLTIVDMIMPGADGSEVFRQIRKINPEAKVIISSGIKVNEKINKLLQEGLNDFIKKPFRKNQLAEIVDKVIKRRGH